jgi:hypothetical protein
VSFLHLDIEENVEELPPADITLAFNIFPYLSDPGQLVDLMAARRGALAVRQYDGAALRFGPMRQPDRALIEASLFASVGASEQFRHYDIDRIFSFLRASPFESQEIEFELFARVAPFTDDVRDYYEATLAWTLGLLSDEAKHLFMTWMNDGKDEQIPRYFYEVDLIGVLS